MRVVWPSGKGSITFSLGLQAIAASWYCIVCLEAAHFPDELTSLSGLGNRRFRLTTSTKEDKTNINGKLVISVPQPPRLVELASTRRRSRSVKRSHTRRKLTNDLHRKPRHTGDLNDQHMHMSQDVVYPNLENQQSINARSIDTSSLFYGGSGISSVGNRKAEQNIRQRRDTGPSAISAASNLRKQTQAFFIPSTFLLSAAKPG